MNGVTEGARVTYREEAGTVVWVQPAGWMDEWSRVEAMGAWMDRLTDICTKDIEAQGERWGRWLSRSMTCDRDRLRAVVRLDARTKRRSAGVPAGTLRYAWAPVSRLRPVATLRPGDPEGGK